MVDTAKSTMILTRALTWFFARTVPSSRKANPPCIASTMIAPSRMNSASPPLRASFMSSPPCRCSVCPRSTAAALCRQRSGPAVGVNRHVGEIGLGHLDHVQVRGVALGEDLDVDGHRRPADSLDADIEAEQVAHRDRLLEDELVDRNCGDASLGDPGRKDGAGDVDLGHDPAT